MLNFFNELIEFEFMRNALWGGLLISVVCGGFSTIVVLRKIEFIGDGIAHATFGGVALGLLLGISTQWVALITSVVLALAISLMSRSKKVNENSIIGMVLPLSMALGIVFLSFVRGFVPDVLGFLFGNILFVTKADLNQLIIALLFFVSFFAFFYRGILYYCFDERMAKHFGVPTGWIHLLVLLGLCLTIVNSVKIAGVVLIAAFLVIPGVTAKMISRNFFQMIVISIVISIIGTLSGIVAGYFHNLPPGPMIVILLFCIFLVASLIRLIHSWIR